MAGKGQKGFLIIECLIVICFVLAGMSVAFSYSWHMRVALHEIERKFEVVDTMSNHIEQWLSGGDVPSGYEKNGVHYSFVVDEVIAVEGTLGIFSLRKLAVTACSKSPTRDKSIKTVIICYNSSQVSP